MFFVYDENNSNVEYSPQFTLGSSLEDLPFIIGVLKDLVGVLTDIFRYLTDCVVHLG